MKYIYFRTYSCKSHENPLRNAENYKRQKEKAKNIYRVKLKCKRRNELVEDLKNTFLRFDESLLYNIFIYRSKSILQL